MAASLTMTGCNQGNENQEDQRIEPDEMYHEDKDQVVEEANSGESRTDMSFMTTLPQEFNDTAAKKLVSLIP